METYLVGGAVRDELLGLPVKDRDWVVVGATPEDMLARGFKQVGADFPVFLHPKTREEYALARTERKQGRGYHGFEVYSAPDVTLEDDLRRRDLTINAMAKSDTGELVDPFHGRDHLAARQLHHVSSAFAEDPLRILRTARFAARFAPQGFTVAGETMALMRDMVRSGEVGHLVPERVWQEIQRALMEQSPTTFFDVLQACGALAVLIPELEQPSTLARAMTALQCCQAHDWPLEVRFAALLSPSAPLPPLTVLRPSRPRTTARTLPGFALPSALPSPGSPVMSGMSGMTIANRATSAPKPCWISWNRRMYGAGPSALSGCCRPAAAPSPTPGRPALTSSSKPWQPPAPSTPGS